MKTIVSALILTAVASFSMPAISDTNKAGTSKKGRLGNPYEDGTDKAATNIINASLGSVGKSVVITIRSDDRKEQRFYVKIPGDKYSPPGDETAKAVLAASGELNSAIDRAKVQGFSSSVVITVEVLPRSKEFSNNAALIKKKNLDVEKIIDQKRKQVLDQLKKNN